MALTIRKIAAPYIPTDLPGAAQRYARAGLWIVALCWPEADGRCGFGHRECKVGKTPLQTGWRSARLGVGGVKQAWKEHPRANIGLLLHAHDLLLIDLDGSEAISEASGLGLPDSPTDQCDRDGNEIGLHLFCRRGGLPLTTVVHRGSSRRIDLKTEGLAVLPPSRRFVDGRIVAREWWPGASVLDLRPGPAPRWAADMLTEARPASTATATAAPVPGVPPKAGALQLDGAAHLPLWAQALLDLGPDSFGDRYPSRSEAVFALVASMIRTGWTDERIIAECLAQPWIAAMSDKHGHMRKYLKHDELHGLIPRARVEVNDEFLDW